MNEMAVSHLFREIFNDHIQNALEVPYLLLLKLIQKINILLHEEGI